VRQRTEDLAYEVPPLYERPRELPPRLSLEEYERQFLAHSRLPEMLARGLFRASRLDRFLRRAIDDETWLDHLLQTRDIRFAPFSFLELSGTTILADEPSASEPLQRAARLIFAAVSFFEDLRSGQLDVDTFRGEPLEIGQYMNLFSTCIHPSGTCTRVYKSCEFNHVIVVFRKGFYKLRVRVGGRPVEARDILEQLREVVAGHDTARTSGMPLPGTLSALNVVGRSLATRILRCRSRNRSSLDVISNAMFVVALDLDAKPGDVAQAALRVHSGDLENRWYFSSLQIVVCGNGYAGVISNFPCGLDGNAVMRFSAEIQRRASRLTIGPLDSRAPNGQSPPLLRWSVPESLPVWCEREAKSIARRGRDVFRIARIGTRALSTNGLRPDPAFVIALIMSTKKVTGETVRVLEQVTLSKYRNMGLGLASVTTREVCEFIELVEQEGAPRSQLGEALGRAIEAHSVALREARKAVSLKWLSALHWRSCPPLTKPLAFAAGMMIAGRPDVIISQPQPRPEVALVGRPGVRFSYMKYFGVHYQIREDRIDLVFMPSPSLEDSLAALADEVARNLGLLVEIAG